MKLRIGFSTTQKWYSRIIRWAIKSDISHTYIRLYDPTLGIQVCFHADLPGVVLQSGQQFDQENIVIEEYELDDERLAQAIKDNMRLVKVPYDKIFLFRLFWTVRFRAWASSKILRPLDDPKKLICTELVMKILNESLVVIIPSYLFDPQELRQWFLINHERFGWIRIVKKEV